MTWQYLIDMDDLSEAIEALISYDRKMARFCSGHSPSYAEAASYYKSLTGSQIWAIVAEYAEGIA